MNVIGRLRPRANRRLDQLTAAAAIRALDRRADDRSRRQDYVLRCAIAEAESAGVTVVETLKQRRADDKVVLFCETVDGKAAVFKYVGRQGLRGASQAHIATLGIAASSGARIFPRTYAKGEHWSLEEWIDGAALKRLNRQQWEEVDLIGFFWDLRHFSHSAGASTTPITSPEIQLIVGRYLRRAVGFIRHQGLRRRVSALSSLCVHRQQFYRQIAQIDRIVENIELSPHLMIDDLNDGNILYCTQRRGPVIIDVEDIKPGILGFDCAWLLTTMARRQCPAPKLIEAYRAILSESFLLSQSETVLSRLLLQVLLTADIVGIKDHSVNTATLLRVVQADLDTTCASYSGLQ